MLSVILALSLFQPAHAEGSTAPKKKANTSIYESEEAKDEGKSFSAKVRIVRDLSDDPEVFFEGEQVQGAYTLVHGSKNYAAMLKALEASQKAGGPAVSVSVDAEKRIKSVEINKGHGGFVPPSDPNKAWDFGKLPD